jgi:hypothetical protein
VGIREAMILGKKQRLAWCHLANQHLMTIDITPLI